MSSRPGVRDQVTHGRAGARASGHPALRSAGLAVVVVVLAWVLPAPALASSLFGAGFAGPGLGGYPGRMVADRFDSSGHADLALVTGYPTPQVDVLLGNGNGGLTLSSGSPLLSGGAYAGITTGDFNNDSNEDIAVTDYNAGTVTVLLGGGAGTFTQAGSPIAVGSGPSDIVAGIFAASGDEDLAVLVQGAIAILTGNGHGAFTLTQTITTVSDPAALGIGMFGTNGSPDLAVAGRDGNVTMLMDNGQGAFTAKTPVSAGVPISAGTPESVAAGYFQNAAHSTQQDLAVGFSNGEASILLNQGGGVLNLASGSPVQVTPSGTQLTSILAVDVNGDGSTDLVSDGYWQGGPGVNYNAVGVMLGDDHGGLTAAPGSPYALDGVVSGVATGAFYGGAAVDIAASDGGSCRGDTVEVLRNLGAGGAGPPTGRFAGDGCSVPASASGSSLLDGTADSPFSGVVAHVDDSEYAARYSAQIDWGDGQSSQATVTQTYPPGFDVAGTHTYSSSGSYPVTVHLTKIAGAGAGLTLTATTTITVFPAAPTGSSLVLAPPGGRDCSQPCDGRFVAQVRDASGSPLAFVAVHADLTDPAGKAVQSANQYSDPNGLVELDFPDVEGVGTFTVTVSLTDAAGVSHTATDALRVHPTTIGTVHVEPAVANQPVGSSVTAAVAVFDAYGNQYTSDPHGLVPVDFTVHFVDGSSETVTETIQSFSTTGQCDVSDLLFACPGSGLYTGAEPVLGYQPFANDHNVANDAALLDVPDHGGVGIETVGVAVPDPSGGPPHGPTAPDQNPILNFQSKQAPGLGSGDKRNAGSETAFNVLGAGLACSASIAGLAVPGLDIVSAISAFLSCGGAEASAIGTQISIADPPDQHYQTVDLPKALPGPSAAALSRGRRACLRHGSAPACAAVDHAGRAYAHIQGLLGSVEEALAVSIDRYQGARQHGDGLAMFAQQGAIDAYLGQIAQLVRARAAAGRTLAAALGKAGLDARLSATQVRELLHSLIALRGVPRSLITRFQRDGLIASAHGLSTMFAQALAHAVRPRAVDLAGLLGARFPTGAFNASYERIGFSQLFALITTLAAQNAVSARASRALIAALLSARGRCTAGRRDRDMLALVHRLGRLHGAAGQLLAEAAQPLTRYHKGASPSLARCSRS